MEAYRGIWVFSVVLCSLESTLAEPPQRAATPSAPRAKVMEQGLTKKKVLLGFYWFWGTSKMPQFCGTLCGTRRTKKPKVLDISRLFGFRGLMK